jgi:hypothetical protein
MLNLKEQHIDEILTIIFAILIFLVGLAWNSVIDTLMKLYGNTDSIEMVLIYAIIITIFTFVFGDYIYNKLKLDMKEDGHIHKLIKCSGTKPLTIPTIQSVSELD